MASINNLSLSGRLVKTFELNKGVAKSSIAINTWDKRTFYVDLIAFKQTAEYIMKCKFQKGDLVVASGELNINTYNEKKYVQCIVKEIDRLGKAKEEVEIVDEPIVESGASLGQPSGDLDNDVSIADDDNLGLPF